MMMTQVERIVEQIKEAILGEYPIIYLVCDDLTIVDKIFFGEKTFESIVPRCGYVPNKDDTGRYAIYVDGNPGFEPIDCNYKLLYSKKTNSQNAINEHSQNIWSLPTNKNALCIIEIDSFYESKLHEEKLNSQIDVFLSRYIYEFYGLKFRGHSDRTDGNARNQRIILISPKREALPTKFAPYIYTVTVPALSKEEIENIIDEEFQSGSIENKFFTSGVVKTMMKESLRGLSALRIRQILRLMIKSQIIDMELWKPEDETLEDVRSALYEAKRQLLGEVPGLTWEIPGEINASGLENTEHWINSHAKVFKNSELAKKAHIDIPKAMILTGIPGTGKSLMAKTTSHLLGLPMISLNMGALRGKYQGESENNMQHALRMVEDMSPVLLFVDEIEKAFGGEDDEDGVSLRLLGTFLTWMQEKKSQCFVVATANNLSKLPPEMSRSERFDIKFFTFMPTADECASIFTSILSKQNEIYCNKRRKTKNNKIPENLFDKELLSKDTWIDILNSCCSRDPDSCTLVETEIPYPIYPVGDNNKVYTYKWKSKFKPRNKLLTGADIASIIKETKFRLNPELEIPGNGQGAVFMKSEFVDMAKSVISEFHPYGETNLREIALCFYSIYRNQFECASSSTFIDFSRFDEDEMVYIPDDYVTSVDAQPILEKTYDRVLKDTIIGAINRYLPQAKKSGEII